MRRLSLCSGSLILDDPEEGSKRYQHDEGDWLSIFKLRAVHELLFDPSDSGPPAYVASLAAMHHGQGRPIVWIDSTPCLYPPAFGANVDRLHVLRPKPSDLAWTATECLRCQHVGAVIAVMPNRLTRVEVRRLQLAAEQGNNLSILIRPNLVSASVDIYSAVSRWLVSPAQGECTIQRWCIEHVHGHGRQFGPSFIMEKHRATGQTHFVHSFSTLVDHPKVAAAS